MSRSASFGKAIPFLSAVLFSSKKRPFFQRIKFSIRKVFDKGNLFIEKIDFFSNKNNDKISLF